jgi:hypothetical protein
MNKRTDTEENQTINVYFRPLYSSNIWIHDLTTYQIILKPSI